MKAEVAVLLVNFNGGRALQRCLEPVFKQSPVGEVIVVDNASTDGSEKQASKKFPSLKLISNKANIGFGAALNQAAKSTSSEFLLVLNTDVILGKNTVAELVNFLTTNKRAGICAPIVKEGNRLNMGYFFTKSGFFYYEEKENLKKETEVFGVSGAVFLIRKSVFTKVSGFDNDFFLYSEDADLCWRVQGRGWKIFVLPISVRHFKGTSVRKVDQELIVFHSFKNRILLLIKNLRLAELLWVLPLHLLIVVSGSLLFLGKGRLKLFRGVIRALFWNLTNLEKSLRKRRVIQKKFSYQPSSFFRRKINWSYLIQRTSDY